MAHTAMNSDETPAFSAFIDALAPLAPPATPPPFAPGPPLSSVLLSQVCCHSFFLLAPHSRPPLAVARAQLAQFSGAVVSVCACTSVVYKHCKYRSVRVAPLSLLFWRTVADLIFSSQFLITLFVQLAATHETGKFWGVLPEYRQLCTFLAFFSQLTAFASEMWLLMICVDLFLSLTQPFRSLSTNNSTYHAVVWLSSLATACALLAFDLDGPSAIHICWCARAPAHTTTRHP